MMVSIQEGFVVKNAPSIPFNEKKIFLLGSSHVGALNGSYIQQQLEKNGFDYKVYNLSEAGDKPAWRIKSLNYLVNEKPDLIVYGIGFRDVQNTQVIEGHQINFVPDRQPESLLPNIHDYIWSIAEWNFGNFFNNLNNPKLVTLSILDNYIGENSFPVPNHVLIKIWNEHLAFREIFPEVGNGNFENLRTWACHDGWKKDPRLSALNPNIVGSKSNDDLISIEKILHNIWSCRPDLQKGYPEVLQGNYTNLLEWAKNFGWKEDPRLSRFIPNKSSSEIPSNVSKGEVGNLTKEQQWYSRYPIATDSTLRNQANQSSFQGFDPNYLKSNIDALDKITKKLNDEKIKIVFFSTPHQRYYLNTIPNIDLKVFHSIFEQLSSKFGTNVYYLDSKYADMAIWHDISHVSFNNTATIYNDDVVKLIMENINR